MTSRPTFARGGAPLGHIGRYAAGFHVRDLEELIEAISVHTGTAFKSSSRARGNR